MKFTIYQRGIWFDWEASSVKQGTVAKSPEIYHSEKEARSAIALARKAMAGHKFASTEVVIVDPDEAIALLANTGTG